MEEHDLAVGDALVIPGVGTLTLKDVEGDSALLGLDLLDEAEEARLAERGEGDEPLG
jgi:hypothetical protein